jgi:probable rRNA maturation factor
MILNRQREVRVARKPLEDFLSKIRTELHLDGAEVTIALVSDAEIARMNARFCGKCGPTDVLSFPTADPPNKFRNRIRIKLPAEKNLGDIAIAPATAKRYAKKNGRALASELRVLMLHGVLHLLGYDHERDLGQMNRVEQRLRRRLGLA